MHAVPTEEPTVAPRRVTVPVLRAWGTHIFVVTAAVVIAVVVAAPAGSATSGQAGASGRPTYAIRGGSTTSIPETTTTTGHHHHHHPPPTTTTTTTSTTSTTLPVVATTVAPAAPPGPVSTAVVHPSGALYGPGVVSTASGPTSTTSVASAPVTPLAAPFTSPPVGPVTAATTPRLESLAPVATPTPVHGPPRSAASHSHSRRRPALPDGIGAVIIPSGLDPTPSLTAASDLSVPIAFAAMVGAFLLLQHVLGRRDPRLAAAPLRGDDDSVAFE